MRVVLSKNNTPIQMEKNDTRKKTGRKSENETRKKRPIGNYIMAGIFLVMVIFYVIYVNGMLAA